MALLGEECWRTAKASGEKRPFCSIAWVQGRVVTVQSLEEHQLLRVTAILPITDEELVEQRMEMASLRDSGTCNFAVRKLDGFLLAEVECYEPMESEHIEAQIKMLFQRLEVALSGY